MKVNGCKQIHMKLFHYQLVGQAFQADLLLSVFVRCRALTIYIFNFFLKTKKLIVIIFWCETSLM